MFFKILFITMALTVAIAQASPVHDQAPAATGGHHERVQIKVFRGPSEGHDHFAPWGYWVKQPADDDHHYRR